MLTLTTPTSEPTNIIVMSYEEASIFKGKTVFQEIIITIEKGEHNISDNRPAILSLEGM